MFNLYIYGYLNRINSSAKLRYGTCKNIEVMWLMDGLKPNDETICNFRRDNAKALRQTFHEFSEMWREQGLYGGKIVVTDVTKIRTK